jgi:hypothetical protein
VHECNPQPHPCEANYWLFGLFAGCWVSICTRRRPKVALTQPPTVELCRRHRPICTKAVDNTPMHRSGCLTKVYVFCSPIGPTLPLTYAQPYLAPHMTVTLQTLSVKSWLVSLGPHVLQCTPRERSPAC